MKFRIATIAAIAFGLSAATATLGVELKRITEVNDALWAQIYTLPRWEAQALVADATMFGHLGELDPKLLAALPYGPSVVMYFAANGDLLAWSDKSKVVELGYWEILDNGSFSEFCIRFGNFGLLSVCSSPETSNTGWLFEGTPGNPFGLVGGAPAPGLLGKSPAGLEDIAATLP